MSFPVRAALAPSSLFAFGLAGLLTACGGGGGGGSAPTVEIPQGTRSVAASSGSDVSQSNYTNFAGTSARVVMSVTGNAVLGGAVGSSREAPQSATSVAVNAARGVHAAMQRAASLLGAGTARETAQAVNSDTAACDFGGTMTITVNDANNDQKASAGDTLGVSFNQCVLASGMAAANGSFSVTINAVVLDASSDPVALDLSGSFNALRVGNFASLSGGFHVWSQTDSATSERMRLSFSGAVSTLGSESVVYNVDVVAQSTPGFTTYAIDGGIGVSGQTYSVVQDTPFTVQAGVDYPTAGALRVKDAAGDALVLTARSDGTVDFAFWPAGSQAPAATWLLQPWSSFQLSGG
jgi:hypothetical protein